MLGLPRKNTVLEDHYFNSDGSLKPGTKGYEYQQKLIKNITNVQYNAGYNNGVKFVLDDIKDRLGHLVKMNISEYEKMQKLPDYASELQQYIDSVNIYISTLKGQINNRNHGSFREGTRQALLKVEKKCGVSEGTFIDPLIAKDEVKYSKLAEQAAQQAAEAKEKKKAAREAAKAAKEVKKVKKPRKKVKADPTDILVNVTDDSQED